MSEAMILYPSWAGLPLADQPTAAVGLLRDFPVSKVIQAVTKQLNYKPLSGFTSTARGPARELFYLFSALPEI